MLARQARKARRASIFMPHGWPNGYEDKLNEGVWRGELVRSDRVSDARLGRPPDVAMVQATDFGNLDDHADLWQLDWPCVGCNFVEREVSSRPVIVREIACQDAAQVAFAKDEDMIQTFAPDRADESLSKGVLPRAARLDDPAGDPGAGGRDHPVIG